MTNIFTCLYSKPTLLKLCSRSRQILPERSIPLSSIVLATESFFDISRLADDSRMPWWGLACWILAGGNKFSEKVGFYGMLKNATTNSYLSIRSDWNLTLGTWDQHLWECICHRHPPACSSCQFHPSLQLEVFWEAVLLFLVVLENLSVVLAKLILNVTYHH